MRDIFGQEIEPRQLLISRYGKQYEVIMDDLLGLSIKDRDTGTVEKLFPEVAAELQIAAIIWVDPNLLMP